jgi:hypothetical protein
MDYYGYFPTFNFLAIEVQLVAVLIGFEALFFIFWYKEKYKRMTRYGKKELEWKDKIILIVASIIFLWITFLGTFFLINCSNALYEFPIKIEILISEGKEIDYILKELSGLHTTFVFWTVISSFYVVLLMLLLDVFPLLINQYIKMKNNIIKIQKKDKKRNGKNNKSTRGK